MARNWATIAKAEFRVLTSRFRKRRLQTLVFLVVIGLTWALYLAPTIMQAFLNIFSNEAQAIFAAAFPGLMRAVILLLWIMVLVYPISYSLQEIRIGQWEIMLSNNVSTREMLFGMFLGKIPTYSLLVLFLAPLLLSPFMIFYQVSIIGQLVIYLVIGLFALSTLFLSTIISTAIQAKLGDSSRGNDLAKAMGLVLVVLFLIPLYSLIYFAEAFAILLGLDVFLILPSTWGADLITWTTITFNGINLPAEAISAFEGILNFSMTTDTLLVSVFVIVVLILGFTTPDRIFSLEAGARTESITTVGRENIFLRAIKRIMSGATGVLVVTTLKDFGRKAQNISKIIYAMFLSILLPLMINFSSVGIDELPELSILIFSFMLSMMLGMIAGITFGGVGFLESKDHLWVIKSAPGGVNKFMKARLIESFLLGIPIVLVPVIIVSRFLSFAILETLLMLVHTYLVLCGAIAIGVGFTAMNPAYENTKSSAFYVNAFASISLTMISLLMRLIGGLVVAFLLSNFVLGLLLSSIPLLLIGVLILTIGSIRLASTDV